MSSQYDDPVKDVGGDQAPRCPPHASRQQRVSVDGQINCVEVKYMSMDGKEQADEAM